VVVCIGALGACIAVMQWPTASPELKRRMLEDATVCVTASVVCTAASDAAGALSARVLGLSVFVMLVGLLCSWHPSLLRCLEDNMRLARREVDLGLTVGLLASPVVAAARLTGLPSDQQESAYWAFVHCAQCSLVVASRLILGPPRPWRVALELGVLLVVSWAVAPVGHSLTCGTVFEVSMLYVMIQAALKATLFGLEHTFSASEGAIVATAIAVVGCRLASHSILSIGALLGTVELAGVASDPQSAWLPRLEREERLSGETDDAPAVWYVTLGLIAFAVLNGCTLVPALRQRGEGVLSWPAARRYYLLTLLGAFGVYAPLATIVVGRHPVPWVVEQLIWHPIRLRISAAWLMAIVVGVVVALGLHGRASHNTVRKVYHALAVTMFVPVVLLDPRFLFLAFGVALAAFLFLEQLRMAQVPPLGLLLQDFSAKFVDSRDSGAMVVTHAHLLAGCAAPLWLFLRDGPTQA